MIKWTPLDTQSEHGKWHVSTHLPSFYWRITEYPISQLFYLDVAEMNFSTFPTVDLLSEKSLYVVGLNAA